MSLPRDFTYAAQAAYELDPTVNPVGVEHFLMGLHGTLDAISEGDFQDGLRWATRAEAESPGTLRRTAASWGAESEFDRAAPFVRRRCLLCKGRGWYWAPYSVPMVRCECSGCRGRGYEKGAAKVRERTIRRDDKEPLVFTGWLVGSATEMGTRGERTTLRLWRVEGGGYVGGRVSSLGDAETWEAEACDDEEAVVAFFGRHDLPRELYRNAGLEAGE